MMKPTLDPQVFIEESREGYVRYRNVATGRRWIVKGTCDRRGDCLIGLVVLNEHAEPEIVKDHAHIEELKRRLGTERLGSLMDQPVTPEFETCCGADRFEYVELNEVRGS